MALKGWAAAGPAEDCFPGGYLFRRGSDVLWGHLHWGCGDTSVPPLTAATGTKRFLGSQKAVLVPPCFLWVFPAASGASPERLGQGFLWGHRHQRR